MRLFTVLLLFICSDAFTQPCSSTPGMTPTTAVPVCGTLTFTQTNVSSCTGPGITPAPCTAGVTSDNSVWYKFHCYQTGTLGFLISPQSGADDYDWMLFDVTGLPDLNSVFTMGNNYVSVNLSANTGPTGCTAAGTSNTNCEGPTSQFNSLPNLIVDHDYLLMVTNWSNSGLGYGLTFGGGTSVLSNNVAPAITNVAPIGCNTSKLKVTFSEDIKCSSVTATGSEFSVTNGTHVVTGIVSQCTQSAIAITELTIDLQSPLAAGNYNLVVNLGSDGNTLLDVCDIGITAGAQIPFTIAAQPAPAINSVTYTGCAPNVLNVVLSAPMLCATVTGSGSEITIQPGSHPVNSVISTCGSGAANTTLLQVNLQNQLPAGNYQMVINNGSDANTYTDTCSTSFTAGYSFPFTIAQANNPPVIQSVQFNECQPDKVILNFDKPVSCASISAAASEFSISPGAWVISAVTNNCTNGIATQITLDLQNNMTSGNFNVNIGNGSDANTISDTCFAFITAGYSVPFTTTQSSLPVFDSVIFTKCNPSSIKVYYNQPIKCSTISADGSDFTITGPSSVTITSATTNNTCSQGYSQWILLQLSQPINTPGNYILHNQTGSDGNGLIDTCNAIQSPAETIGFNVLIKPDASFTNQIQWGCTDDIINLSHPGGNSVNSWLWSFSDGQTGTGAIASHSFPVTTVNAGIQLIVSNGFCSDTSNVSIPLNNVFQPAFTIDTDTSCVNSAVTFRESSSGSNLQYHWQFGDNTVFNGQNPPAHIYTGSNDYTINLIVTDQHGCKDTASKQLFVTPEPFVNFTGLNAEYCTRDVIALTGNMQGNISSYTWNNGSGQTSQNVPSVNFMYNNEGQYNISLTIQDRFCGAFTDQQETQVWKVPIVELGADETLCPGMRIQIGVPNSTGYIYTWNNGITSSQIMTDPVTNTYHLLADNHGCVAEDEINVIVLEGCLIRVPGAFTPNSDGRNDQLKATNAFLATNFTLIVYNRFGQMLYKSNNPLAGWDGNHKGQPAEPGTYVWQLSYTDPWTNLPVFDKGTSILIR